MTQRTQFSEMILDSWLKVVFNKKKYPQNPLYKRINEDTVYIEKCLPVNFVAIVVKNSLVQNLIYCVINVLPKNIYTICTTTYNVYM